MSIPSKGSIEFL